MASGGLPERWLPFYESARQNLDKKDDLALWSLLTACNTIDRLLMKPTGHAQPNTSSTVKPVLDQILEFLQSLEQHQNQGTTCKGGTIPETMACSCLPNQWLLLYERAKLLLSEEDKQVLGSLMSVGDRIDWLLLGLTWHSQPEASSGIKAVLDQISTCLEQQRADSTTLRGGAVLETTGFPSSTHELATACTEKLGSSPCTLEFVTDKPRAPDWEFKSEAHLFNIPIKLQHGIQEFVKKYGCQDVDFYLALWQLLIYRYSRQENLVIGLMLTSPIHSEMQVCHVQLLPIRVALSGNHPFHDLMQNTAAAINQVARLPPTSAEQIADLSALPTDKSPYPLYQALLIHECGSTWPCDKQTVVNSDFLAKHTSLMDMTLCSKEHNPESLSDLQFELVLNGCLFDGSRTQYMAAQLCQLVESVLQDSSDVLHLEMVSNQEVEKLKRWSCSDSAEKDVCDKTLHATFMEQATKTPSEVAICEDESNHNVTYDNLKQQSTNIANKLLDQFSLNDRHGSRYVGVMCRRSTELVVSCLGALQSGAAYVYLAPDLPDARLLGIAEDAQIDVTIMGRSEEHRANIFPSVLRMSTAPFATSGVVVNENSGSVKDPMYVLYTSGSTGKPKGVQLSHEAVLSHIRGFVDCFKLNSGDVFAQLITFAFDMSVSELWTPLLLGAKVVLPKHDVFKDFVYLATFLDKWKPTVCVFVPSVLTTFLGESKLAESIHTLIIGGEAFPYSLCRQIKRDCPRSKIINGYGPTESAVYATYFDLCNLSSESKCRVPIGTPCPWRSCYILDLDTHTPAPLGVPGELNIGGRGLADYYLNMHDATRDKFICDFKPFSDSDPIRVYKSGDLARWRPDGNLECLGRLDCQVKISGYRIELEEIENKLHDAGEGQIHEVKVIVQHEQLIAFASPKRVVDLVVTSLIEHCRNHLPEYMVPARVIGIDEWPRTVSGKVDAKQLGHTSDTEEADAAATWSCPEERDIAEFFASMIQRQGLDIDSSFTQLGMQSLHAIRARAWIQRTYNVKLTQSAVMEGSVRAISKLVHTQMDRCSILRSDIPGSCKDLYDDVHRLSYPELQLWMIQEIDKESPAYNESETYFLEGQLSIEKLHEALNMIVSRHEVLRSVFKLDTRGQPQKHILPMSKYNLPLTIHECDQHEADRIIRQDVEKPFDLASEVMRVMVMKVGSNRYYLHLNFHHIIMDVWAMWIFWQDLSEAYRSLTSGSSTRFPAMKSTYMDFAREQHCAMRKGDFASSLTYWQSRLATPLDPLALPLDKPRPPQRLFKGKRQRVHVSQVDALRCRSNLTGATLFDVVLSAYQLVLSHLSQQKVVTVGAPVAGRDQPGREDLFGYVANTLPLRTDLSGHLSINQLIQRVHRTTKEAFDHDAPFVEIAKHLRHPRSTGQDYLYQAMLIFIPKVPIDIRKGLGDVRMSPVDVYRQAAWFDTTLACFDEGDYLQGYLEISMDVFMQQRLSQLVGCVEFVLEQFASQVDAEIQGKFFGDIFINELDLSPNSELEHKVMRAIGGVLPHPIGNRDDLFFDGGLNSLGVIQVVKELTITCGCNVSAHDLFRSNTIWLLTQCLMARLHNQSNDSGVKLSYNEKQMLVLWEQDRQSSVYNHPDVTSICGPLCKTALRKSLLMITRRHDVLRSVYMADGFGETVRLVKPIEEYELPYEEIDISSNEFPEREAQQITLKEVESPFDLAAEVMRLKLICVSDKQHYLILSMSHVVMDGKSTGIIWNELSCVYSSLVSGKIPKLPCLATSYQKYAREQQQALIDGTFQTDLEFWREALSGELPLLELPSDRLRPKVQTFDGAILEVAISPELSKEVQRLALLHHASLFETFLTMWQLFLCHLSMSKRVVVGAPIAGRADPNTSNVVGYFANCLAFLGDFSSVGSFEQALSDTAQSVRKALDHASIPFAYLVENLALPRDPSRNPVYQAMMVHEGQAVWGSGKCLSDLDVQSRFVRQRTSMVDVTLWVIEDSAEPLACYLEYSSSLFTEETAQQMMHQFVVLIREVVDKPTINIWSHSLSSTAEIEQLRQWSGEASANQPVCSDDVCLHDMVFDKVAEKPHSVALQFEEVELTYCQLKGLSLQVASKLGACDSRDAGPSYVGVLCERSLHLILAYFGTLHSRAAYVYLELTWPDERLATIIADAGLKAIATQSVLQERAQNLACRVATSVHILCVDQLCKPEQILTDAVIPKCKSKPSDPMMLLYTSGSTGTPKGVQLSHEAVLSHVLDFVDYFALTSQDVSVQTITPSFDMSVTELYPFLVVGAKVVLAKHDAFKDFEYLNSFFQQAKPSFQYFVPSIVAELLSQSSLSLSPRCIVLAGEPLSASLCGKLFNTPSAVTGVTCTNAYGPTEAQVVTMRSFDSPSEVPDMACLPIGKPTKWRSVYICRAGTDSPTAAGVPGELMVGGRCLADCYVKLPDLTASKFWENAKPFQETTRLYRTGDLARWQPNGDLQYLGRIDQQVKLNGLRIELGEIEETVRHGGAGSIHEVKVVKLEQPHPHLVAYATSQISGTDIAQKVLQVCQRRLPNYMIPAAVVMVDAWPRTSSGKLDLKKLVSLSARTEPDVARGVIEPGTKMEILMGKQWQLALEHSNYTYTDDFFQVGGSSLQAAKLLSLCRKIHSFAEMKARDIYEHRSIQQLAKHLSQKKLQSQDATKQEVQKRCQQSQHSSQECAFWIHVVQGVLFLAAWLPVVSGMSAASVILHQAFLMGGVHLSIFLSPVARLIYYTVNVATILFLKYLIIGTLQPGRVEVWTWPFVRWWFCQILSQQLAPSLAFWHGTPMICVILRLLGANVIGSAKIRSTLITDWDLLEIGDGVTIEREASLCATQFAVSYVNLVPVILGEQSHVSCRAHCGAGSCLSTGEVLNIFHNAIQLKTDRNLSANMCQVADSAQRPNDASQMDDGGVDLWDANSWVCWIIAALIVHYGQVFTLWPFVVIGHWSLADLLALTDFLLAIMSAATLLFCVVGPSYLVFVLACKVLIVGTITEGFSQAGWWTDFHITLMHQATDAALYHIMMTVLEGTPLICVFYRGLGASIGQGVLLEYMFVANHDLLHIGDRAAFGGSVLIDTDRQGRRECVTIGSGALVGNSAVIEGGVKLGDHSIVGNNTVAVAGNNYNSNTVWLGTPAWQLSDRPHLEVEPSANVEYLWAFKGIVHLILALALSTTGASIMGSSLLIPVWASGHSKAWPAACFILMGLPLGMLTSAVFTVAVKWTVYGKFQESQVPFGDFHFRRWLLSNLILYQAHFSIWRCAGGSAMYNTFLRALGTHVGKGVFFMGQPPTEPDLLILGDGAFVGPEALFQSHVIEERCVAFQGNVCGPQSVMGFRASVLPGCDLGCRTVLEDLSLGMKGAKLDSAALFQGLPAEPVL